jgi:ABC-2 type transport system permease protein
MFNLFRKTIYDKRAFIIGWAIGMILFAFVMMIFFPAFKDSGLDQLLANLPPELKSLKGLIGDIGALSTPSGYLAGQFFDIRMPMFLSVFSVILAIGLSIKDEEAGYIRTLLALPLSRTKLFFGKFIAIVAICLSAVVASAIGLLLGAAVVNVSLDLIVLFNLSLVTLILLICMTTLFYCVGIATGKRTITMLVGVLVSTCSFLLTTFAKSVDWLQPYENASLFHYFPAADIVKNGIFYGDILVYVFVTLISILAAVILFRRRDVR